MNEDYLWDKAGEPDAEIERLEQMLGSLRYQRPAEPLPLPARSRAWTSVRAWLRPAFSPAFAIAATLVILLLAGGWWLGLRRAQSNGGTNTAAVNPAPGTPPPSSVAYAPPPPVGPVNPVGNMAPKDEKRSSARQSVTPRRVIHQATSESAQSLAKVPAINNARRARSEEIARGQEAKAQLIKALLITSDKLNTVQKKIQGTQERNPIS